MNISDKKEIGEMVETILGIIKKGFPDTASTIVSEILKIEISVS